MLFDQKSLNQLKPQITLLLNRINRLAPETKNPLVQKLKRYSEKIGRLRAEEYSDLMQTLEAASCLLKNLELGENTVHYIQKILQMQATNNPYDPEKQLLLEQKRSKLNERDLTKIFATLHAKRKKFESPQDLFEQEAYRKGTGYNISMWYRDAHHPSNTEKLANCTEQTNAAFVYLYLMVMDEIRENKPAPFKRIERVDVENRLGGHSYLLLDKSKVKQFASLPQPLADIPCEDYLSATDEFGDVCVVIDPWNKNHPFFPASDMADKMPKCGLSGTVNFEFALDFSSGCPPKDELESEEPVFYTARL
ncbi:hypothetical protein [Legionella jordanis]|uniref:Uncharacterized protein n=1 Tax=Legionella jordanis TaxID=456 RepID=A0A0W0VDC3_9GAMM|nr:hypothetical protein [Legionella jordanis]KTD18112.1 hypothetical protein Ljor_2418 [Legionella jordanis]RMX00577.1 hypothetical protein EAW55_12510 [Legionella jordanis]RMX21307.1 hypothetical protein EAS68_03815 [Legionella jordanis]VEH13795.1 Uncharacterised protein [Legionella jordanis]HAT8714178.1 hypothetical protein [Legionella jordanis]